MGVKVTTKSGREYLIDSGRWRRMPKFEGEMTEPWCSLFGLMRIDPEAFKVNPGWPWTEGTTWEDGLPEVGQYMFISGKDWWWISTAVVSIEEYDYEVVSQET